MMGGPGRFGNLMEQDVIKPRSLSSTLRRLGGYFGRFSIALLLAMLFVVIATWTQVTTPELIGQATDCFLVPQAASQFGGSFSSFSGTQAANSASSCWLVTDPAA